MVSYAYQGLFAFLLSFASGLVGRFYLRQESPQKSFYACLAVVTAKSLALSSFIYWEMYLSISITSILLSLWVYRSVFYFGLWRDYNVDRLHLEGYSQYSDPVDV